MWEIHLLKNGKIRKFTYNCGIIQYDGMQFLDDSNTKYKERSVLCMCMNYIRKGWILYKCINMPDLNIHIRPNIISFTKQFIVPDIDLVKDKERYILIYDCDIYIYAFHTNTFWKKKNEVTFKNHDKIINKLNEIYITEYCEFYIHDGNIWLIPQSLIHYYRLIQCTRYLDLYTCPLLNSNIQLIPTVKILRDLHDNIDYYL